MLPFGPAATVRARTNAAGTTAAAAGDFLNSIAACSSITGQGETLAGTIEALTSADIRFIRSSLEDRISVKDMIGSEFDPLAHEEPPGIIGIIP